MAQAQEQRRQGEELLAHSLDREQRLNARAAELERGAAAERREKVVLSLENGRLQQELLSRDARLTGLEQRLSAERRAKEEFAAENARLRAAAAPPPPPPPVVAAAAAPGPAPMAANVTFQEQVARVADEQEYRSAHENEMSNKVMAAILQRAGIAYSGTKKEQATRIANAAPHDQGFRPTRTQLYFEDLQDLQKVKRELPPRRCSNV